MEKEKISLCIICKNEEGLIKNAIESAKNIVDEIIVVDTGSSDNTIEVAKSFNAKIIREDFFYDFSDIRNKAIENASSEWILFLDCDEELEDENKVLEAIAAVEEEVAISFRVGSYLEGIKRSEDNIIRLFKNKEDIRFSGRIHENILSDINKNYDKEKIMWTDIEVKHYGSDKEIVDVKEKLKRNLKVFSLYSYDEKDANYYFNIGNEYGRMLDFDAALENYDKALEKKNLDCEIESRLILNKAKAMHKLELFSEEKSFLEENIKEYGDFRDLYFLKGLCEVQLCQFEEARESIKRFMETKKHIKYPSSEFEALLKIDDFYENIKKIASAINM